MRTRSQAERDEDDVRFTKSLAGLAVALALLIFGLYLVDALAAEARLEDCLLAGRSNCAQVDVSPLRQ
jgi:hypothetical protein